MLSVASRVGSPEHVPAEVRGLLRELGFAYQPRGQRYRSPEKWYVHLFYFAGAEGEYLLAELTRPDEQIYYPRELPLDGVGAVQGLKRYLRACEFPVDVLLRQRRLKALID